MQIPFAATAFVTSTATTLRRLAQGDRATARALLDRVMAQAFPAAEADPDRPADPLAPLRRTGL